MQLWTYHPTTFRLDDPGITCIDPTCSVYWHDPALRYREALQALRDTLGLDAFPLWCHTARRDQANLQDRPLEWELAVPIPDILAFIHETAWDAVLRRTASLDLAGVIVEPPTTPDPFVSALVHFPVASHFLVRCHGPQVSPLWRGKLACYARIPERLQRQEINRIRERCNDPRATEAERKYNQLFAEYLEEQLGLTGPGL